MKSNATLTRFFAVVGLLGVFSGAFGFSSVRQVRAATCSQKDCFTTACFVGHIAAGPPPVEMCHVYGAIQSECLHDGNVGSLPGTGKLWLPGPVTTTMAIVPCNQGGASATSSCPGTALAKIRAGTTCPTVAAYPVTTQAKTCNAYFGSNC